MTACACETQHRQDREGTPLERSGDRTLRAVPRAAGAPLRYYQDGAEVVEYAPRGDLGTLAPGAPFELRHGGPVIGRTLSETRTDEAITVEIEITDPAVDIDALLRDFPHVSADYTVGAVDPDGAQRQVRIARIAAVERGRCGDSCFLRKDESGAAAPRWFHTEAPMKITIAGKEYEAGSPEAVKAMTVESQRLDALGKTLAADKSKALRKQVSEVFKVEVRADALDPEILIAAVKKVAPGVDLSGQSDDYIAGAFAVAISMAMDMKGPESEPGPDDQPAPAADAAPKPPAPAAGAAGVRADVFTSRAAAAERENRGPAMPARLAPDQIARRKMIQRNGQPATGAVRTVR